MRDIIKYKNYSFYFDCLDRDLFDISSVWCEYYSPEELNDIPEDWLNKHIYSHMDENSQTLYYAVNGHCIDCSKREFVYVLGIFVICGHELPGYLFVCNGEVNSVSIFLREDIADIFSSELLSDDNIESLEKISKEMNILANNIDEISYKINTIGVTNIPAEGSFAFPI